jgi:hypothetical protein
MSGPVPWKREMVCEKCIYLNGKNADGAAATLGYKSAGKVSVRDAEVGDID